MIDPDHYDCGTTDPEETARLLAERKARAAREIDELVQLDEKLED